MKNTSTVLLSVVALTVLTACGGAGEADVSGSQALVAAVLSPPATGAASHQHLLLQGRTQIVFRRRPQFRHAPPRPDSSWQ